MNVDLARFRPRLDFVDVEVGVEVWIKVEVVSSRVDNSRLRLRFLSVRSE